MKKMIFILIGLVTFSFSIMAQMGKIKFDKMTHDYGDLKMEIGRADATFTFTNVGDGDLKIVNVKTSCGCTASDYSKNVIKPGEQGFVKATYSTTNRPGPFRKTITVTTNDVDNPNTILTIKGNVFKKDQSESSKYPIAIGNLRLINNHIAFNQVKNSEIKVDSVKIFNDWDKDMTIKFDQIPPYLKVYVRQPILGSQESTYIVVEYDATNRADFGLVYDRVSIITNDLVQPVKTLNISANIIEDFSTMTPKMLKKAPKIVFETTDYQYDSVQSGTVITYSFKFTNTGKSNLIIRKTKASCGCTAVAPESTIIKKGKSSSIEIKFDTRGYSGVQHKTVTVITNDPNNPEIVLNIHGLILKKP